MTDYKHTLNLPETAFSMKANLPQTEPARLKQWESSGLYEKIRLTFQGKEKFILHDGPPYANGKIHTGHALNKILKDMMIKSKTLSGFDAPYVPGWDCHGLPIELNVEKKVGRPDAKISAEEFRVECRKYAAQQVDLQRDAFVRLGVLGDWNNPYLTMDFKYEADQVRAISKIIEQGHLQKGYKPVYWCNDCRSSLALAEVEYKDKQSPSIYVAFLIKDWVPASAGMTTSIVIWTTTPWTLPANQAVAVHPELTYVLIVGASGARPAQRYIVAENLLEKFCAELNIENHKIVQTFTGRDLAGKMLQHPFYDKQVPIVLSHHVTADTGTGAVHIAPSHGEDDFRVGKENHLNLETIVGHDGCYIEGTEFFAGLHVTKANDAVIEKLKEKNTLLQLGKIEHSYPHCWRHKTPLIFRATPQWFVSMSQQHLREKALAAIKNVSWLPETGFNRISAMIENSPDWCISRQRTWGVPLPLFIHKQTNELHPRTQELLEEVAKRIEKTGVQAWFDLDAQELLGADAEFYDKSKDTVDVWLDSGVSHFCVLRQRNELQFPADVYLEGSDQHRGWFQSSLLSSLAISGEAPYKEVVTHGFLVDDKGYKMSKSLGNVIEPEEVIKTLGADILRLWVASTDYHGEIAFSNEILKHVAEVYRRIRNTARYLLSNLYDFNPECDLISYEKLLKLDQFAIGKAYTLQEEVKRHFREYKFHDVYHALQYFCSIEMGGFYLDVTKDRQYTMPKNSLGRRAVQTTMFHILHALVRCMAPILSFTADEIWEHIPGKKEPSVFLTQWYEDHQFRELSQEQHEFWTVLLNVRKDVNKKIEEQRAAQVLGSSLEAKVVLYVSDEAIYEKLNRLGEELRFLFITSEACLIKSTKEERISDNVVGVRVEVASSQDKKCVRCWHRRPDVGNDAKHPELCGRCVVNVDGPGEERYFV